MSLIYSFVMRVPWFGLWQRDLVLCLLASQEQYELVAETIFTDYYGAMSAVRTGNEVDIRLFPHIRTDLPGGRIRLDVCRRAVRRLDVAPQDVAMRDHEHPAFDLLARQLPRLNTFHWRRYNEVPYNIHPETWTVLKKTGETWSELELEIERPSHFSWLGGATYLSRLTSMLALPLSSLDLCKAGEDFDEDLGIVVSDLSRHCSQLRSLILQGSFDEHERIEDYKGLFSTSLISVCLSTMKLENLGMILAWNLPNLRDVRLTFWSDEPYENPPILLAPAANVKRTSSNLSTLSFEFFDHDGSFKHPDPESVALWLSRSLNLDCRLVPELRYTHESERRWFEEVQARYLKEREVERESNPR